MRNSKPQSAFISVKQRRACWSDSRLSLRKNQTFYYTGIMFLLTLQVLLGSQTLFESGPLKPMFSWVKLNCKHWSYSILYNDSWKEWIKDYVLAKSGLLSPSLIKCLFGRTVSRLTSYRLGVMSLLLGHLPLPFSGWFPGRRCSSRWLHLTSI